MADSPATAKSLRQTEVVPPGSPDQSSLVTIVVGAVLVGALYLGREVFIPIVLAMLLSFVLGPFVDLLRKLRLGRGPSTIAVVVVALGIILGVGSLIGGQIADLASDLPRYRATISEKVTALRGALIGRASTMVRDLGREVATATQQSAPSQGANAVAPAHEIPAQKPMPVQIQEPEASPTQILRDYLGPVLGPFATAGIVLVVVVFILIQREDLRDRMIRLFGSTDLHRTTAAMDDAARRLSRYFLTQLALNAGFGVLIGLGLWAIGVPNPVLWGIITALMRFVPYIGAFISALLPAALAAAVDPGWTMVAMTLGLYVIAEPLMGHVVEPLVYGHSTGLSPFAVVVSAIFWTWLWGPMGLILSTPLTVCLVVLGRHVERLEFLDVILGDRPALTPVENFYQRMLAGDPDEAIEHAEELLKTCPLSTYYDDVALKGLQLAANDAVRGVLTEQQIAHIKESISGLVEDLSTYDDAAVPQSEEEEEAAEDSSASPVPVGSTRRAKGAPPPEDAMTDLPVAWRHPPAILCIAGRGTLDEAASTMLAQVLQKNGFGPRVVPHDSVARSNILGLDVDEVEMVCVSYLDISGSPAHLRYLIRRLRQKLPKAPILVGMWPAGEEILTNEDLGKAFGADYYVTSLREAVEACRDAAGKAGQEAEKQASRSQAAAAPEVQAAAAPA